MSDRDRPDRPDGHDEDDDGVVVWKSRRQRRRRARETVERDRQRTPPPRNPDGTKATARDTEAFAASLIGMTRTEAETRAQQVPHISVLFVAASSPLTTDWSPFRVWAGLDKDSIVVAADAS